MTTEIRIESACSLLIENDVYNLVGVPIPEGMSVAGASFTCPSIHDHPVIAKVLRYLFKRIDQELPGQRFWLLLSDSAWQPDTRVARYYKLWRRLARSDVAISQFGHLQEVMHQRNNEIRYFGACELIYTALDDAAKFVGSDVCSYLAALPKGVGPNQFLEMGWTGRLREDITIIVAAIGGSGLLIKKVGAFDDPERGFVVLGESDTIKSLVNSPE